MLQAQRPVRQGRHAQETEPERVYRLKECCDLLLAGGYFRARMPTLSPFDKVVGGMVWCITASNVDVDVDLLYEENSSIGERIRVSENIVRSLNQMKCPYQLSSFQIQGLDYNSILPVLKWLIRQVIETRALTGDENRQLSLQNYHSNEDQLISYQQQVLTSSIPSADTTNTSTPAAAAAASVGVSPTPQQQLHQDQDVVISLDNVHEKLFPNDNFVLNSIFSSSKYANTYHTTRKYKKRQNMVYASPIERVESTLLEYDDRHIRLAIDLEQHEMKSKQQQQQQQQSKHQQQQSSSQGDNLSDIQLLRQQLNTGQSQLQQIAQETTELQRLQEETRLKQAQDQLDRLDHTGDDGSAAGGGMGGSRIQASVIGDIVSSQSHEINRAREQYHKDTQGGDGEGGIGSGLTKAGNLQRQREMEEQRHQRQCDNLRRKIVELQQTLTTKQQEQAELQAKHQTVAEQTQQQQSHMQTIQQSMQELEAIEQSSENREVLGELKQLVVLNEQLKKQEQQFKQSCKEQLAAYQQRLQSLQAIVSSPDSDMSQKLSQVQSILKKEQGRYEKLKDLANQQHLQLLAIYHKIDEIPTRAELLQFEKRFIELYEITSRKLIETRGYFSWYNTLSTTYSYLQQELTLLESILSNFAIGMKTKQSQEAMKNQMAAILATVQENIDTTQGELDNIADEESVINAKYTLLLNSERNYFKLVKQFQLECDKNEQLLQAISQYE